MPNPGAPARRAGAAGRARGAGIDPDAEESRDGRFEFGLDCVMDGIAVKIAEFSAGGSP